MAESIRAFKHELLTQNCKEDEEDCDKAHYTSVEMQYF